MSSHTEAGRRPTSPVQTSDREQEQDEDDSHDQQALLHKSEDPSRTRPPSRMLDVLITLTYCVIYLLVGPALILVNKKIMKVQLQHLPSATPKPVSKADLRPCACLRLCPPLRMRCRTLASPTL